MKKLEVKKQENILKQLRQECFDKHQKLYELETCILFEKKNSLPENKAKLHGEIEELIIRELETKKEEASKNR